MRRIILTAALLALPALAQAQESDSEWLEDCQSGHWHSRRPTECDVRVETVPIRSAISVRPGQNGAVMITSYSGKSIEIHARMQASSRSRRDAADLLKDIRLNLGQTISASGPDDGRDSNWSVSFVIFVPRTMDVNAATENGPIAIDNVFGNMDLRAHNGPISLSNVGGDVRARTQNGPLHVRLSGSSWRGAGLDAETANGPIALEIPHDYNAQLETGTVNGPMESDFPLTVTLRGRDWKHFSTKLGNGGAPVRVVTTNGPVSVRRP